MLGYAHSALATAIAGNPFFPGTITFDDAAVPDEPIPRHAGEGEDLVRNRYGSSFPVY